MIKGSSAQLSITAAKNNPGHLPVVQPAPAPPVLTMLSPSNHTPALPSPSLATFVHTGSLAQPGLALPGQYRLLHPGLPDNLLQYDGLGRSDSLASLSGPEVVGLGLLQAALMLGTLAITTGLPGHTNGELWPIYIKEHYSLKVSVGNI